MTVAISESCALWALVHKLLWLPRDSNLVQLALASRMAANVFGGMIIDMAVSFYSVVGTNSAINKRRIYAAICDNDATAVKTHRMTQVQ